MLRFTRTELMGHVATDEDFAEWFVESFLKSNVPGSYYAVSHEGKREMTTNGRQYARGFGLTDPEHQARFVALMWQIGANFFAFRCFRKILDDPVMKPDNKFDRIFSVPREEAVEAIMGSDARWWYPYMVPEEERHLLPPVAKPTLEQGRG